MCINRIGINLVIQVLRAIWVFKPGRVQAPADTEEAAAAVVAVEIVPKKEATTQRIKASHYS